MPDAAPLGERVAAEAERILRAKAGYVTPERDRQLREIEARQERREHSARAEMLLGGCNIWPIFEQADLDDVDLPRRVLSPEHFGSYVDARDVLAGLLDDPMTIVLSGANGPGKSHLASAAVRRFCQFVRPAYFTTAMDFYTDLRSTFGAEGRTQRDLIARFRRYELLVLDELEVRSDSAWENNQLRDLIGARHASLVSTVLITNKTPAEIDGSASAAPYLSPAIRDRMRGSGGIVWCNWPSLRGLEAVNS